jgi:quercetin dioxygenase-like cupin family protein
MIASIPSRLFGSFFLGGFECSTHLTVEGHRLDVVAATQHDVLAREDYGLCRDIGIKAVRESARWPFIDRSGVLDLNSVRKLACIGREEGMTLIWDLMHYGYPDDLDPFSNDFTERFAAYARAAASVVREETEGEMWFTPINEISYSAWAAGEVGYMAPFAKGRGPDYKRALVRAAIVGTNAIWEIDPGAHILTVDPLVHIHAPAGRPDLKPEAEHFNARVVTEAFDMLCGHIEPELGGSRAHLGVVGFNYYAGNQWTIGTPDVPQRFLGWDDPEWIPLSDLLVGFQERYGGPLMLAESGSSSDGRAIWLEHLTEEVQRALELGVDLQGICLYPIVSSPDWEDPTAFFDGGIFDVAPQSDGTLMRILSQTVAEALRNAQAVLDPQNLPAEALAYQDAGDPEGISGFAQPLESVRFKPDNFSCQTLVVGDHLTLEVYGFEPGGSLPAHRHAATEHVLTVLLGRANVRVGRSWINLRQGESVLVAAGLYHGIHNYAAERLVMQQVSSPKPWDARFSGLHPKKAGVEPRPPFDARL